MNKIKIATVCSGIGAPEWALKQMGFDDSFKQVVSDNQMYKQSGNSMCVGVLKALFTSILNI